MLEGVIHLYKKLSSVLTDKFVKSGIIEPQQRDVYCYGFEILLSYVAYILLFVVLAVFTGTIFYSLLFGVAFFTTRSIAGGYHAATYSVCHLLSLLNQVLFILLIVFLPQEHHPVASVVAILISSVLLLIFAPIDHPNKPFIKTERKRFRKMCCVYAYIIPIIVAVFVLFATQLSTYILSFSLGIFSAAFALLSAKIQQTKEKQNP